MVTTVRSQLSWERLVYNISFAGFLLIFIFSCANFKNYQDSEVPADQIATVDGANNVDGLWEVKADQEKVLIYQYNNKGVFFGNLVYQFKLKPGNYEIYIENMDVGLEGQIPIFRAFWSVNLQAGHNYRVFYDTKLFGRSSEYAQFYYYYIKDLTTGEIIAGNKP